jgi:tripartite-type tricarboxylate transporter receptor subunit TctC
MKKGTKKKWFLTLTVAGMLALVFAGPVLAKFPDRAITLVAPFAPGGTADLHARAIAPSLEKILGVPVTVLNKSGAGGALGAAYVGNSKPDGYTLVLALTFISYMPAVDELFGRTPTFTFDQFTPIALLSKDPAILVVKGDGPYKNVADLVADAKKRPGAIKYSSAGFYSTLHVAMEMFLKSAGIKMKHIPYRGGNPAMMAVLGGHVDALAVPPSVVAGQVKSGDLRVLAVWSDERIAAHSNAPTLKELGYDAEFYVWAGIFAPKKTPTGNLKILRDAVGEACGTENFKKAMKNIQTVPVYMNAEQLQKFWDKDVKNLKALINYIGKVQ